MSHMFVEEVAHCILIVQIQQSLTRDFRMHPALVKDLARWADVQSLSFRASENDVTFRSNLAKRYLALAVGMYRLTKATSDPSHLFALTTSTSAASSKVHQRGPVSLSARSTVVKESYQSSMQGAVNCGRSCTPSGMDFQFTSSPWGRACFSSRGLSVLHPGIPSMRQESSCDDSGRGEDMPDSTVILDLGDDELQEQDYGIHDPDTESELLVEADINFGANYPGSDDENWGEVHGNID